MSQHGNDAVYLHVGPPKTGTTYVQEFLWINRIELARAGLLYPGDRPGRQFKAALDVRGTGFAGNEIADVAGSWASIAEQVREWDGRSVISHEILAGLRPKQIENVIATVAPHPVHLVVTLRDFSRIVPATWQEGAKNRFVESWPDFLERVRPGQEQRDRQFWSLQDVPRILRQWAAHIPAEHIHVVTVPPAGPRTQLLQRLAQVLDFDPEHFRQEVVVANDSIGTVEVALLQRVNEASHERLSWPAYHQVIKHFAVPRILAVRPDMIRVTLPEAELGWVQEETKRVVSAVEDLGVDVVGDLADIEPRPAGPDTDPTVVSEQQQLDAAVDLVVGLATRVFNTGHRVSQLREERDAARAEVLALTEGRVTRTELAKRRIVRFARRHPRADALLDVYRRARDRRA
ncbi:MAG: hypothetical protein ACRDOJ_13840 [Nocardioidaceae bacterium]